MVSSVPNKGWAGIPFGYYAASKVRDLDIPAYEALFKKRGEKFNEHVEHLVDGFLRSQDAFFSFNLMGEPGTSRALSTFRWLRRGQMKSPV